MCRLNSVSQFNWNHYPQGLTNGFTGTHTHTHATSWITNITALIRLPWPLAVSAPAAQYVRLWSLAGCRVDPRRNISEENVVCFVWNRYFNQHTLPPRPEAAAGICITFVKQDVTDTVKVLKEPSFKSTTRSHVENMFQKHKHAELFTMTACQCHRLKGRQR